MKMTFFTKLILGLSLAATGAFAQSFCNTASHSGTSKTESSSYAEGNIGGNDYAIWYDHATSGSATFYSDGSFSCSFQNAGDYLCREGVSFGSTKTYKELDGDIIAEFKLVKQNVTGVDYSFVGVYGWMTDVPGSYDLVEYYVVDNWLSPGAPNKWTVGNDPIGDYTIDGAVYTVYQHARIGQPSIRGNSDNFNQYFSIRTSARDCGVINVTAHMKKWEELGLKPGKLYEAKVLGEAGSTGSGVSGTADFPHAKVYIGSAPTPTSSSSVNPGSSSAYTPTSSASPDFGNQTPYSSNSIPGTIEIENFDEGANGEAYNEVDGTDEPQGGSYRPDVNVDIIGVGSGYGVGYTGPSEWLEYTVDIPTGGTYNATIMIANGNANAAEVSLTIDGNSVGSISAPSTDDGKWQVFAEASTTTPIRLPQGRHILRVSFPYCNADWLKFELVEADPDAIPFAKASVNQPTGKFQVFDMQGKLLGYIDMARGNSMQNVLKQKFRKSGVYLVRQGDLMQKIAVR